MFESIIKFSNDFFQISERFYEEFKRHNYVTPTSYLALILTFKSLLKGKKNEIINMKTRYEMGLGKLEFASNQAIFRFTFGRFCNK
jgi:dynein heavy chain